MSLRDDILNLVNGRDFVSFVQLGELPGVQGDYSIEVLPNVVLWSGLSREASDCVHSLRKEGLLRLELTEALTYFIDGAAPTLPLVRSEAAARRGYKHPHWLPVVLRPGPQLGMPGLQA